MMNFNYSSLIRTLTSAGLELNQIETGRIVRCKTSDDRTGQQTGWSCIFNDGGSTVCVYGSWRDSSRYVWRDDAGSNQTPAQYARARRIMLEAHAEQAREQYKQWADNKTKLIKIWNEAKLITCDDAVGQYLLSRGLQVPAGDSLRIYNRLAYWHEGEIIGYFPTMIGFVSAPTGELITLHKTYLTPDGKKANVPIVRKLSPAAGPMAGASIKFGSPARRDDGTLAIGIAEGLETALSASRLWGLPVWSAISTSGLVRFEPPPNVTNVYIFSDNDSNNAGQVAAQKLAQRLTYCGLSVRVHEPSVLADWNDELRALEANV